MQNIIGKGSENKLMLRTVHQCSCPGDILSFECMVIGNNFGTTVWRGSAFDCTSSEISLLHSLYVNSMHMPASTHAYGDCNNGSIVAESLRRENTCYISQLNVTVSADMIGKSIECIHDDASTSSEKSVGIMNIITGKE